MEHQGMHGIARGACSNWNEIRVSTSQAGRLPFAEAEAPASDHPEGIYAL